MKKLWLKIQDYLDIRGGAILGTWSVMMIALSCYCVVSQHPMPTAVSSAYGVVIGAFAMHKTFGGKTDD